MKPWHSAHAYTSLHRTPGGLRRLEFFRARIARFQKNRPAADIRIICVGDDGVALPLAACGYQIIVVESDAKRANALREQAIDLNLKIDIADHLVPQMRADIVIVGAPAMIPPSIHAQHQLGVITENSFEKAREHLISSGLRPIEMSDLHIPGYRTLHAVAHKISPKPGSGIFHAVDEFDAVLAPFTPLHFGKEWLYDARPGDPAKPFILQIMPTLGAGGAERVVYELAKALPAKGFEVETISIIRGGEMEQIFAQAGLEFSILNVRGLAGLNAVRALRRRMRISKPAIVHTHLFGADIWATLAARLAGIHSIMSTEHSINKDYTPKHLIVKRIITPLIRRFVVVSSETKEYLEKVQHISPQKISIVRNGIDLAAVIPRGDRHFHTEPKLLIVARLILSKGHLTLFKALATLTDRPWRLQIAGNGPAETFLRNEAERLGILPRIEWLGYRTDIPELLARADIFCFPSQWEGLGLAMIEAAAAGIPVLSSNLSSLREVLSDQHALFVPSDTPEAWADALHAVLDRPDIAIRRAQSAVADIHERFSIERMTVGYAAVYKKLIGNEVLNAERFRVGAIHELPLREPDQGDRL